VKRTRQIRFSRTDETRRASNAKTLNHDCDRNNQRLLDSAFSRNVSGDGKRETDVKKWEYKVVHVKKLAGEAKDLDGIVSGLEASLNDLGASGWEVCLEINGGVILKRLQ
jgi:hypothetical protein